MERKRSGAQVSREAPARGVCRHLRYAFMATAPGAINMNRSALANGSVDPKPFAEFRLLTALRRVTSADA